MRDAASLIGGGRSREPRWRLIDARTITRPFSSGGCSSSFVSSVTSQRKHPTQRRLQISLMFSWGSHRDRRLHCAVVRCQTERRCLYEYKLYTSLYFRHECADKLFCYRKCRVASEMCMDCALMCKQKCVVDHTPCPGGAWKHKPFSRVPSQCVMIAL